MIPEIVARVRAKDSPSVDGWLAACRTLRPDVSIAALPVDIGAGRVEWRVRVSDPLVDAALAGYLAGLGRVEAQGLFEM
jgi:hypothetical protein